MKSLLRIIATLLVAVTLLPACRAQSPGTPLLPAATPVPTSVGMDTLPATATPTPLATPTATATLSSWGLVQGLPRDQTLVLAEDEPITLDPAMSQESTSHQYVTQIFSGLVRLDSQMRVAPDLAERWDVLDGGTRYVFRLRPGAKFHSGRRVTAQDVLFSLERAASPATGSLTAPTYLGDIVGVKEKLQGKAQRIAGLRAPDDSTVEIRIDGPKAYFLAKLTSPVAFVVDSENVARGADWYRQPNGIGPFRLKEWEKEQYLILERNKGFYREVPQVSYVLFRFLAGIPMSMYERGDIDVAYVSTGDLERVQDPQSPLRQELRVYPELSVSYLGFNTAKPPFDDPMVRRAFALAVDVDKLAQVVRQGRLPRALGLLPPGIPGYIQETQPIPYDPIEARRLMTLSRYGGAGKLPPITYTTPGQGGPGPTASALVEMWRASLGVEVSVRQLPPDAYYYRLREEVDNIFDFGWVADYPDPENILDVLFHSGAANNIGAYASPQLDALLEAARIEQNVERRLAMYRQAQELVLADAVAIPLWHGNTYVLVKRYVLGYVVTPGGLPALESVRLERK
ncbi:MAG: peptide ABC transporter substrate-binding protein [Dehalococcoidia bacterium]|nr:peptide ABC transporter substrate-binding protein [Dehalococcoidia bacterium]